MRMLAAQPGAFFIGQGVAADGVATYDSLDGIPVSQRLELPVIEELQMGMGVGLALYGNCLPILVYPRIDFLLRAADALVNHLDKLPAMSRGQWAPKVIIRTRVGSRTPLDAGPQHSQCHADAFRLMLTTVAVEKITREMDILPAYNRAIERDGSTLIVEALH